MIPYADFNCLVLPRDPAVLAEHILELGMLPDVLPTGCNAAVQAGVGLGKTVYIAGCGPIGLCAAASSFALSSIRTTWSSALRSSSSDALRCPVKSSR